MEAIKEQFEKEVKAPKNLSKKQTRIFMILAIIAGVIILGAITYASANKALNDETPKQDEKISQMNKAFNPVEEDLSELPKIRKDGYQNVPVPYEKDVQEIENNAMMQAENGNADKMNSLPEPEPSKGMNNNVTDEVKEYELSYSMRKRLNSDYQAMVSHFKENKNNAWEAQNINNDIDELAQIEKPLQNLYDGAEKIMNRGSAMQLSAGTRLLLVSDNNVSSDHPGVFTATVIRPFELKGAKVLLESGANQRDRIPVQPQKIIYYDKEYPLNGQVEMTYNGLEGDVKTHVFERLGPAIANAAIGGLFSAWVLNNENMSGESVRIDTRDAIAAPIIQESVTGVQSEVSRLGGDYPNTVTVPEGTEFKVLLTQTLSIGGKS